ncbi:MAG: ester cyclase [Anaerolineae bacterium]|nr:ester cyclase [Anaerolineae bacterium]
MSLQENKRIVRELVEEVWSKHQLEKVGEFITGELLDEAVEHTRQFLGAFPDVQVTIQDLIAEGDKVVARLLATGTHTGPFAGRPPTGRRVTIASFRMYRLTNGKVVESWAMQDRLGLMEQLGFVESAGSVNWAAGDNERSEEG